MSIRAAQFQLSKKLTRALFLVLVLAAPCATSVSAQNKVEHKRVLILFHSDAYGASQRIVEQSLRSTLQHGSSGPVEIYSEYLDSARTEVDDYEKEFVTLLRRKYEGKRFDLIFAITHTPLTLLLRNRADLFPGTPIVYLTHDRRNITSLNLPPEVTGVWGEINFKPNLELALALHPGTRKVAVVSGVSEWDKYWRGRAQEDFRAYESSLEFNYLVGLTSAELRSALAGLPPRTIVIFITNVVDRTGNTYETIEVLRQISSTSSAPIYGTTDAQLGSGIVGGSLLSFEAVSTEAARVGLRVLAGEKPEAIAPHGVPSVAMFDWRELKRWGLSETSLPAGSIVSFRQLTFWDQYKWYVIAVVAVIVVQLALIAWLLFTQSKRRQAEQEAEKTHRRLQETVSNVPGIVWEANYEAKTKTRRTSFISDHVRTILGYTPQEWLAQPPGFGMEIMVEEDRAAAERAAESAFASGKETACEHRWKAKDGRIVWVETSISPILNRKGQPEGLRGVSLDITARKLAEATVEKTEEKDRAILEAIPDLMFLQTRDGVYLDLHYSDPNKLLVPPAEYLGKNMREILPPDLAERFAFHFAHAIETRETQIVEYELTVNGERRWYESRIVCSGENILSVVRDITERKQAEETHRRQVHHAALRAEVSSALAEGQAPLQAILQRSTEAVVQHLDAALARIWTVNKEEGVLELQASSGLYTHLDGQHARVPVGELKIGLIAKERRPHLTNNVLGDPRVSDQQWAKDKGMVAFAGYPLLVEERLVGVIAIFAQHRLTEHTIEALASIADTIAQGIERRQAESALRASEARLKRAQQAARVGTWEWHVPTGESVWSEMIWELLGLKPGDRPMRVETFVEFIHPEDRERALNKVNGIIANGDDEYFDEFRIIQPDGEVVWLSSQGRVLRSADGKAERIIGVNLDITKRKAAEETAREAQEKDAAILEAIPDLMFLQSPDGVYLDYHANNAQDLFVPPEEFVGKNMTDVLPPELARNFSDCFARLEQSSEPQVIEYTLPLNGTERWFECRVVRSGENMLSVVRDITERLIALNELRESEERFATAFRANPQPMTLTRLSDGTFLDVNEAFLSVTGYRREEVVGHTAIGLRIWETASVRAEFIQPLKEGGSVVNVEREVRSKDGSSHLLLMSAERVELGGEECVLVASTDITERKRAEEALHGSEERYRTLFESIDEGFCVFNLIYDEAGRAVDFVFRVTNPAFERQTGWRDAVGVRVRELAPNLEEYWFEKYAQVAATNKPVRFVNWAAELNRWYEVHAFSIGEAGSRTVAVLFSDVSERVQAQQTLQESEARFRNMADTAPVLIWTSGPDNECTYVNQRWLEFTGRTIGQELGTGWIEGIHPDDAERCATTYASALEQRAPFKFEYRLRRADGEFRWMIDTGTARFSATGQFLGYIGSCMDITDRKQSEQAVLEAHDQLVVAHAEVSRLKAELEAENIYLREELQSEQRLGEMVGESDAIKYVMFKVKHVAVTDSTVLITGETGTGKELVARAIHSASLRSDRPLITVNCAVLPANLIESELFGHEKGAFTGAAARKLGRFELANGGTIFLDEIGELPLESQVKLLRVLQEGEIERLGGSKPIKIDVRIIAATNRNLKSEIDKGSFREDLWYRLNVFPITAPPLRTHKEDIPLLVEHFVSRYAKKLGKKITSVSPRTLQSLETHAWPGNVRELANVIERAVINTQGNSLNVTDVFEPAREQSPVELKKLEQVEREYIIHILEHTGWRIEGPHGAAKLLGLNPSTLRTRMIKLGIFKQSLTAKI